MKWIVLLKYEFKQMKFRLCRGEVIVFLNCFDEFYSAFGIDPAIKKASSY